MGGGGGIETEQIWNPQQQQMFGYGTQMLEQLMGAAQGGQGLWGVPQMPNVPEAVGPTAQWYSGIAPEVQQSLWEPVHEAQRQMTEAFGSRGQLGSARAGPSGAFGAATGELFGRAAPQIGMQAWDMMQPGMMQRNQQLFQQGMTGQAQQLQSQMAPWQMFPQMMGAQQAFMPETISYQKAPSLGEMFLGGLAGGLGSAPGAIAGGYGAGLAGGKAGGGGGFGGLKGAATY